MGADVVLLVGLQRLGVVPERPPVGGRVPRPVVPAVVQGSAREYGMPPMRPARGLTKFRSNHALKFAAASRPMATVSFLAPPRAADAFAPTDVKALPLREFDVFPPGTTGCLATAGDAGDLSPGTAGKSGDFSPWTAGTDGLLRLHMPENLS